jgi:hypothetical protein
MFRTSSHTWNIYIYIYAGALKLEYRSKFGNMSTSSIVRIYKITRNV